MKCDDANGIGEEWTFDLSLYGKKHFELLEKQLDEVLDTSFSEVESLDSDLARRVGKHIQVIKSKDEEIFNDELDLLHQVLCWMLGEVSSILKYDSSKGNTWRTMYKAYSLAQNYAFIGTAEKNLVSAVVEAVEVSNDSKFRGGRRKGARNRPKGWEFLLLKILEQSPNIKASRVFQELRKLGQLELDPITKGNDERGSVKICL